LFNVVLEGYRSGHILSTQIRSPVGVLSVNGIFGLRIFNLYSEW